MGGLMTALALRESGVFDTIDVFEQTPTPSTAGAGLNIPPNGARLARWLGVDLDGGDPKGPDGAIDGGRAAILEETRMIWEDNSVSRKPLDHNTAADDHAGFHHMHRLDLLMCLYKRVFEFAPETGVDCPIQVHMAKGLADVSQDDDTVTVTFSDGTRETGDLLIGADGVNSQVLEAVWPGVSNKRWTEVTVYRGVVPRDKVATARKLDGSPLDHNPIDASSMDSRDHPYAQSMSYWIRGHELLNVWLAYYEPNSEEFEGDEGDWFPVEHEEMLGNMGKAFGDDPRRDDVLALAGLIERPTKWGLYDRDALENWTEGRVGLVGDAAHPMLPTFGQGAAQAFEDAAALGKCFELHGTDIYRALLHYERVRYYRATRFQFASKFLFKHLEPEDTPQRRQILKALNERDYPVFDHTERAGSDDSWIYAFDARNIGDKLPIKKLGPWDFRSREDALTARKEVARSLWKPAKSLTGRPARHARGARTARDVRRLLGGHPRQGLRLHRLEAPPPGRPLRRPHVRRQGRHGGVRRLPHPARRAAHGALLRGAVGRRPGRARRGRRMSGGAPTRRPTVGMLLYPGMTLLDLQGPLQTVSRVMDVHLCWKDLEPVPCDAVISVLPTLTLEECPANLDVLFVPGGRGMVEVVQDDEVLAFLADRGARARFVTSVCTGSLVIGAAGLLDGYRASCHWGAHDLLTLVGAVPVHARIVEDRNRITAGGVTAGIDFGLTLVARMLGEQVAKTQQLLMEYDPAPPYDAGTPASPDADAEMVGGVESLFAPLNAAMDAALRNRGHQPA